MPRRCEACVDAVKEPSAAQPEDENTGAMWPRNKDRLQEAGPLSTASAFRNAKKGQRHDIIPRTTADGSQTTIQVGGACWKSRIRQQHQADALRTSAWTDAGSVISLD